MSFRTRLGLVSVLLAGTTVLAACGGGDGGNGPDTLPDDEPSPVGTFFAMENHSSRDAYYVYIRSCGATEWGADRLGASTVLDVNERITWTVNDPGCYDVRAVSAISDGTQQEAVWEDVQVPANQTTTVRLEDSHWGPIN